VKRGIAAHGGPQYGVFDSGDLPHNPAEQLKLSCGVLGPSGIENAHIVGLSMGGIATLHSVSCILNAPRSIISAGAGYGSKPTSVTPPPDCAAVAERFEREAMSEVAADLANGPAYATVSR